MKALVAVFSIARLTIEQVYTESLIFLVLAVAIAMIMPAAGVLLVLLHAVVDLPRTLMTPFIMGSNGPIGVVAGRFVSFYLLWLLVVEISVIARTVPWVVMGSARPANPAVRQLWAIGSTAVAVGVMTWIWTQAAGILIRPVFTWSNLGSPNYNAIANLQVSGMTIVAVAAVAAGAMAFLRIQHAVAERGADVEFDEFEDFDLDQLEAEPNEGLGLLGQVVRHMLAVFLLGGLISGLLDLAILGGVSLLSQPIASRILRAGQLRRMLSGIPWVVRFVAGFGLTFAVGYVINTVRYEPLGESEFFPLVITVAFGLILFQVLLADAGDEDEAEADAPAATASEGSPSAGSVIGAALVLFAVGAMLQLAFPGTAFADNCSGLIDCNPIAAAAAAGAAASRSQNARKRRRKRKKRSEEDEPADEQQPGEAGTVAIEPQPETSSGYGAHGDYESTRAYEPEPETQPEPEGPEDDAREGGPGGTG